MVKDTRLYDILEVSPDATDAQIKKAYNTQSKLWHPDKHQDPAKKEEVTKKFQEITQAKEILLNPEKRQLYDQIGMEIFNNNPNGDVNPGPNPFGDFGNIFGNGFPFGGFNFPGFQGNFSVNVGPKRNAPPENIFEQVEATLEQIVNKASVNVNYKQKVSCLKCNGEGTKNGMESVCKTCGGKGMQARIMRMGPIIQQIVGECTTCNGKGQFIEEENKCDLCYGKGWTVKDKNIQLPLSTDVLFGQDAVFENKGHQLKNQKTHLIVKIKELPHKVFKRYKEDLYVEMELKLYQALFGFDKVLTHLDGRKLHISCSGKTNFNTVRKISGEGIMNLQGKKGDLYIRFIVNLPNFSNLPTETKTQLKALLQSFDKNEVLNETAVSKTQDLVKTTCIDLKQDSSDKLAYMMDGLKFNKSKTNENMGPSESDVESEVPKCVQQ